MTTVIDEFDLDIRLGEPLGDASPVLATKTTDGEWCADSHCPTCGRACTGTTDYCDAR